MPNFTIARLTGNIQGAAYRVGKGGGRASVQSRPLTYVFSSPALRVTTTHAQLPGRTAASCGSGHGGSEETWQAAKSGHAARAEEQSSAESRAGGDAESKEVRSRRARTRRALRITTRGLAIPGV
eukprot:2285096-Pleurochrysis_carterae.AAC.3